MGGWQVLLEIALIGLLGAMLFHALRLERALGVVRRDRAELENLLRAFNDSTQQAESAIERLRSAADGAGRHVARQVDLAANLKEDLVALIERGERVADRMDTLVRANREPDMVARRYTLPEPVREPAREPEPRDPAAPRVRSQAERDLLRALKVSR